MRIAWGVVLGIVLAPCAVLAQPVVRLSTVPVGGFGLPIMAIECVDTNGYAQLLSSGLCGSTSGGGSGGAVTQGAQASTASGNTWFTQDVALDALISSGKLPVSGTFWQATQPVSGTFWQATQPVSGTFWQATQPVSGTFWQATQPVSETSQGPAAPGTAPSNTQVAGCIYNATLPTFTTGQSGAISCDANGQPYTHPNGGNQAVTLTASTTNGVVPGAASALINAAGSAMATSVKASAGQLYGYTVSNATSGAIYFRLFNLSAAPTVGTSVPYRRVLVPAGATVAFSLDIGIAFGSGIAFDVTAGSLADSDTTTISAANTVAVTLDLK